MKTLAILSLLLCTLPVLANEPHEPSLAQLDEDTFHIRLDNERPVSFYGKVDVNGKTGDAGGMMYPAANAGVLLASILLHSAIAGSAEKKTFICRAGSCK